MKSKVRESDEHTFKPQLSQKSLQIAKWLGSSRERLTRPKKKFMDTRKSVNNLTRDHSSKYLNSSRSPSGLMNSKSFSHYSENYDPSMNESFKPNINAKSRKIDREMSKSPNGQARFERLYQNRGNLTPLIYQFLEYQEAKIQAMKHLYEKDEILKEIENCSFKPKINNSNVKHVLGSVSTRNQTDVYNRNEMWQKHKEMKIMSIRSQNEHDLSNECTFKPKISPNSKTSSSRVFESSNSYRKHLTCDHKLGIDRPKSKNSTRQGVDKFISRHQKARNMKQNAKMSNKSSNQSRYLARHLRNQQMASIDTSNDLSE